MSTITLIPSSALHPNEYNPNRMDEEGFRELVAEVRHLGRLPKPIVVRSNGAGYVIVDGEHGWRAACELKLGEIPCEVIDADDFEARRQTYKRNQHGEHDPVLLGRMFREMMEARSLSRRALAEQMEVSEGTIRNALLYAEASEARNGYAPQEGHEAISLLTVREARGYLSLPAPLRDRWLEAGADLRDLERISTVRLPDPAKGRGRYTDFVTEGPEGSVWPEILDLGLAETIQAHEFVESTYRAVRLWWWVRRFAGRLPDAVEYVRPLARMRLNHPEELLDRLPVRRTADGKLAGFFSPERWVEIVERAIELAEKSNRQAELLAIVDAALRLEAHQAGDAALDLTDPRDLEFQQYVESLPDYLREADVSDPDKIEIAQLVEDAQAKGVDEEWIEEAAREAISHQNALAGWLRVREHDGIPEYPDIDVRAKAAEEALDRLGKISLADVFQVEIDRLTRERQIGERNALLDDVDALLDRTVAAVDIKSYVIRTGTVGDLAAADVLRSRLQALPVPERMLLCAYLLSDASGKTLYRDAAHSTWHQAVCRELGVEDGFAEADA